MVTRKRLPAHLVGSGKQRGLNSISYAKLSSCYEKITRGVTEIVMEAAQDVEVMFIAEIKQPAFKGVLSFCIRSLRILSRDVIF